MRKIIHQHDNDQLFEACGGLMTQLLDRHGRELVKEATSNCFSRADLDALRPSDNYFMAHAIAMGSTEAYGFNRNADGFAKEALQRYHPTFVSHGHLYREHRNRDPKTQGIGFLKAAKFNEPMQRVEIILWADKEKCASEYAAAKNGKSLSFSMSCFPGHTPVTMADGTVKPIKEITPGDLVVTHHGNLGIVSHTMWRDYDGEGAEIKVAGIPEPITPTADHPLWVRPAKESVRECPVCGEKFNSLKAHLRQKSDAKHRKANEDLPRYCEGWMLAGDLVAGDYMRIPVDRSVKGDVDADLAWLLGLYMAEGHIHRYTASFKDGKYEYPFVRLDLTLGSHETDLAEKARSILQNHTTNKVMVFQQNGRNVLKVRLTGREGLEATTILEWLQEHGGHLGETKRLSVEALKWPPSRQKKILEGWLDGDGTWSKKHEKLSGVTTSERLAAHMQMLAARCGMAASLSCSRRNHRKPAYNVSIGKMDSRSVDMTRKPCEFSKPMSATYERTMRGMKHQEDGKVTTVVRKRDSLMYVDEKNGHLYSRVRKVTRMHLKTIVYDLTVPGDHGFVAGGLGVSNCRVPNDRCNVCDHTAKRASDYCDHMMFTPGQYLPGLKKYAFVHNDHPTFFDLSFVGRPADRIAHFLEYKFGKGEDMRKAASSDMVIRGVDWADYDGLNIPDADAAIPLDGNHMDALRKLASAEEWLENRRTELAKPFSLDPDVNFAKMAFVAMNSADELSDSDLDSLRKLEPGTLFRHLAKKAAVLNFPTFVSYVTGKPMSDVRTLPVVKAACCGGISNMMRSVLDDVLGEGGSPVGDMFGACNLEQADADSAGGQEIERVISNADKIFGCKQEVLEPRAYRSTSVRKFASEAPNSSTEDRGLVHAYGIYKAAALSDIISFGFHGDSEKLALLLAGQNFN